METHPAALEAPYQPDCYLCPGNARSGGVRNPSYENTFVFDNDFPVLKPDCSPERQVLDRNDLLVAEREPGISRVVCFSPRHDLTLATMPLADIEKVVQAWTAQFRELGARQDINHVQIFENRGVLMGASNPHPHCQIWATYSIPDVPAKELASQQTYAQARKSCLLCDYFAVEEQQGERVICANDGFVAVVPFWAVWPFEVMLGSRRHLGSFAELNPDELTSLSDMLKRVATQYDRVFDIPFPYSMGFHQSPTDGCQHPEWHFHAHFYPPLLRSAKVRKFMVGFEMLGTPQRDITPEVAAARLRALARAE